MNDKTKIMVSLASAYAAGCIPCFDHYYMVAREENIDEKDVLDIITIAKKVRNGADVVLNRAISDVLDGVDETIGVGEENHPCSCG